jgi:hypothetical protein
MATAKGVEITNLDTTPRTLLESASGGGTVKVFMDTIAAATTDIDDDDIILLAEVPSNAKILSIKIFNDDLDSGGLPALATDVGVYNGPIKTSSYAANAVIDRDCYATASAVLQAAVLTGTEVAFEVRNVNAIANFVWEDAGLSADPGVPLRIALTMETVAATAAAGDITMQVTYSH